MAAAREGADIWWNLSGRWPNGKWRGWELFNQRHWRNPYLFHDSIGKYWARLVTCRVFGHDNPRNVNDPGEPLRIFCFRCMRDTDTRSAVEEK